MKYILFFGLMLIAGLANGRVPLLLGNGVNSTGIPNDLIQNIGNVSKKTIIEEEYPCTLPDGKSIRVLVRTPIGDGTAAPAISGIVFIAPLSTDDMRFARTRFPNALVRRLGCAVITISMVSHPNDRWIPGKYYVYKETGYFDVIKDQILKVKEKYGEDLPLFTFGMSSGGVMALNFARSQLLPVDGAVAFDITQDDDITPGLFDSLVPSLIINNESRPWNAKIARRIKSSASNGAPVEFCITRPLVNTGTDQRYVDGSGGMYGYELAYCFIRDAIEAIRMKSWPGKWAPKSVQIKFIDGDHPATFRSASEDFDLLYKLGSHNSFEVRENGTMAYHAISQLAMDKSIVVVKSGLWDYQDQIWIASLAVANGYSISICNLQPGEVGRGALELHIDRFHKLGLRPKIIVFDDRKNGVEGVFSKEVVESLPCVLVSAETSATELTVDGSVRRIAFAKTDAEGVASTNSSLIPSKIWIKPAEMYSLLQRLEIQ